MNGRQVSEASSVFIAAPHCSNYLLSSASFRSVVGQRSKCNVLELFGNHLHSPQSIEELSSVKPVPGAKTAGDHWF